MDSLRQNISESPLFWQPADGVENLVNQSRSVLLDIIDDLAPLVSRNTILRPHAPWYTESIHVAKREKRRRERIFMHSGLTVHKQYYKEQCDLYNTMLCDAESLYHRLEIEQADQQDLFSCCKNLTKPSVDPVLPDHSDPDDLATCYTDFFRQKLSDLEDQFVSMPVDAHHDLPSRDTCSSTFSTFHEVSEDEAVLLSGHHPSQHARWILFHLLFSKDP